MDQIADAFFAAVTRGDTQALIRLYAPEARVWHNDDGREQTVAENLRVLRWLARTLDAMRYEDVRRQLLPNGFAQMHVLRATLPGFGPIEAPATLIVRIGQHRITRIDEYTDPADTAALRARADEHRRHA